MTAVDKILARVREMSPAEQNQIVRELTRSVLVEALDHAGSHGSVELPLTETEIDRIVHEARRETLRARGV